MPPERPSSAFTRRVLRETTWFAILQAATSVLALLAHVALARVLDPRDFGVYGICAFYVGLGSLLGDGGLGAALLRRRDGVTAEEYRATLTALLTASALLGAALFAAAPWIAAHNHFKPGQVNVLRAMSPLFLVGALRVVPYIRLEREMLFSRIARIEGTASALRHTSAIALAVSGAGVWSLVISTYLGAALQLALAYKASPGWAGLGFSWRALRPLISYGGKVQALGACAYLKDNVARAMLGALMGPQSVGAFDFGMSYIESPCVAVNNLARVQLPVYARLEPRDPALRTALHAALRAALLFGLPMLGALALSCTWVIPVVYGAKWAPAYPVVWGLLANMASGLIASPLFTLLQGQGRAGTALGIFAGWTAATWGLALAAAVVFPGSLGAVAVAHSLVTVVTVAGIMRWASRTMLGAPFAALGAPCAAAGLGLAAGGAVLLLGPGMLGHPLLAAGVFLAVYAGVLALAQGRMIWFEFRAVVSSARESMQPAPRAPVPVQAEALRASHEGTAAVTPAT